MKRASQLRALSLSAPLSYLRLDSARLKIATRFTTAPPTSTPNARGSCNYRPYREASAALLRLLRRFVAAAAVEKASIDEAFVLCAAPPGVVR